MATHPLAGKPAPTASLIDVAALEHAYKTLQPNLEDPSQRVAFGTSGHRGNPMQGSFNDAHIAAITQAVCEFRKHQGNRGPLFLGRDTHAASTLAEQTALEVLAAHHVETLVAADNGPTATPVVSHAILTFNHGRISGLADGLIITPSHNPPQDGGFKYNPTNGGPADTDVTGWIEKRANELLTKRNLAVRRLDSAAARSASTTRPHDFTSAYVADLGSVLDMEAIRKAGLRIGVDPLGGASLPLWKPIAERYGLDLTLVNDGIDPTFRFMTLDHDGQIRMDCSSPYAMAGLVGLKDRFDIAFGNDPDADRHGIVTRSVGLMNPNHFLAVAIRYLLTHRPQWPTTAVVGKTLVSSSLIDRVVAGLNRSLMEVPVGFKWFAPGLFDGTCVFGGEESAGASFLRRNGATWTTDKDGVILGLLAAEITAVTGRDPGEHYLELTQQYGASSYTRQDAPATPEQKNKLKKLSPDAVRGTQLAGEPILAKLTAAPGNGASIGGLKVVAANGWFAARPSGTENIYKLYAESFHGPEHLQRIVTEAQALVSEALQ